jgi:hypothetical protein
MRVRFTEKVVRPSLGVSVMALFLAAGVHAQNVGIGFTSPNSKLTVNGNFAVGTDYNVAAPTDGAIVEGLTGIGVITANLDTRSFLNVASTGSSNITLQPAPASAAPNIRSGIFFGSSYFQCTDSPSNGTKDLTFFNIPTQTNVLTLAANNNVGINTTTPFAPLHVAATVDFNFQTTAAATYFNFGNNNSTGFTVATLPVGPQPASAIFANDIWTNGSIVSTSGAFTASDARLKKIIGRSNSAKDLETLEQIEVTDYTMKDTVKFGNKLFKKVVAQQVEKVYPTAVTSGGVKGFTFTPDIYAVSESVKIEKPGVYNISLARAHDLKDGDTVRLITYKSPEVNVVAHIVNDKTFTVETKEPLGDKVFVYGKQCTDLKAVDYDAISMLNVSATQELAKKVEALQQENHDLQDQNKRLTSVEEKEKQERATIAEQGAEIAALRVANEKLNAVAAKMEAVEKALARMQERENSGVRTAALEQ